MSSPMSFPPSQYSPYGMQPFSPNGQQPSVQAYPQAPVQSYPQASGPQYIPPPNYYYGPQSIAAPPANSTYALQQYLPLAPKRQLSTQEESNVQQGLDRWYPKIMPGYATPLTKSLSNPGKTALINGGIAGIIASIPGGLLTFDKYASELAGGSRFRLGLAAVWGLGATALVGIMSYFGSRQRNDNLLEMIHRLPEGATRRDMLSDPVVQADRTQSAMASGGGGFANDWLGLMLLSNMMGSGNSSMGIRRGSSGRRR